MGGKLPRLHPEVGTTEGGFRARSKVTSAPRYRETFQRLGLRVEEFQTAGDLNRLPLLEREQLQRDPEYFRARGMRREHLLELRSGGSTGRPISIWYDAAALLQSAAHTERIRSILTQHTGRRRGYRETVVVSRGGLLQKVRRYLHQATLVPQGWPVSLQWLAVQDPPAVNLPEPERFRPDILSTFGSYLGQLAPYFRDSVGRRERPKVII